MSDAPASVPRKRRLPRRLLALALSFLLALVLGELVVRAFVGAPMVERLPISRVRANALRGWEMLPSELHYTYLHPVRMNALGLRGAEVPEEKGGELRVLALGDSLVYGQGVADEDTVPAALEAELRDRDPEGRSWRVVNAGHRGYATNQELGLLRELGRRVAPDVVVLFWYPNDLDEPNVGVLAERLERSGPVTFDTKSVLAGRELLAWRVTQLLRRSALVMFLHDALLVAGAAPMDARTVREGLARLDEHLASFVAMCDELGAAPLVAILPEAAAVAGPHPTDALYPQVAALAQEHRIPVVDLEPTLAAIYATDGRLPVLRYDGHYDERANHALGAAMVEPVLRALDERGPGR